MNNSNENLRFNKNLYIPNIINHLISKNSSLYHNKLFEELYAADIYYNLFSKDIFDNLKYDILKKNLFINEKNLEINQILYNITGEELNIKSFINLKLRKNSILNSAYNNYNIFHNYI